MLSTPKHSCKWNYGWSWTDHRGFQPYYRCNHHPSHWLPELAWWEWDFLFSKSWAQVGTPSCCSDAKGNKPPKNGYGGKFPLTRGKLIKTREMEKERWKRLFSTLSQRCRNQTCAHIQNYSNDSYLLVPEFKAAEVQQRPPNSSDLSFLHYHKYFYIAVIKRRRKGLFCFYFILFTEFNNLNHLWWFVSFLAGRL